MDPRFFIRLLSGCRGLQSSSDSLDTSLGSAPCLGLCRLAGWPADADTAGEAAISEDTLSDAAISADACLPVGSGWHPHAHDDRRNGC